MLGPYTELRPTLPKVNAAGVAKAAGLNHMPAVCIPGLSTGCPVTLERIGFSPSTVPEFAVLAKTEIVYGKPVGAGETVQGRQFSVTALIQEALVIAGVA